MLGLKQLVSFLSLCLRVALARTNCAALAHFGCTPWVTTSIESEEGCFRETIRLEFVSADSVLDMKVSC